MKTISHKKKTAGSPGGIIHVSTTKFKDPVIDSQDEERGFLEPSDIDERLLIKNIKKLQKDTRKKTRPLRATRSRRSAREDFINMIRSKFKNSHYSNNFKSKINFTIDKLRDHEFDEEVGFLSDDPIDLDKQPDITASGHSSQDGHNGTLITTSNENIETRDIIMSSLDDPTNIETILEISQRSQTNNESESNIFSDGSDTHDSTKNSQLSITGSKNVNKLSSNGHSDFPVDILREDLQVSEEILVEVSNGDDEHPSDSTDHGILQVDENRVSNIPLSEEADQNHQNTNEDDDFRILDSFAVGITNADEGPGHPLLERDQQRTLDEKVIEMPINGSAQKIASNQESEFIQLANNTSEHPPTDYVGGRRLRPRTLKQIKPYLVDRYEHEAQLVGDFKRARLLEQAALEQNTDLLEKLQEEDRIIREKRMLAALEREKAREKRKSKRKKRNKISMDDSYDDNEPKNKDNNESDDDSEDSELLSIFNKYNLISDVPESVHIESNDLDESNVDPYHFDIDIENIYDSDSVSSEDEKMQKKNGIEDSQIIALKKKLSKVHVLPKSYIRQVIQDEKGKKSKRKPIVKSLISTSSNLKRKGLAVRKYQKAPYVNISDILPFVDDNQEISNNDVEVFPNPYLNDSPLDFNDKLFHLDDDNYRDFVSDNSDIESVHSSVDSSSFNRATLAPQILDDNSRESIPLTTDSHEDIAILDYRPIPHQESQSLFKNSYGDKYYEANDECIESGSSMIDRMLSYNSRKKTVKSKSLIKSSSDIYPRASNRASRIIDKNSRIGKSISKSKSINSSQRKFPAKATLRGSKDIWRTIKSTSAADSAKYEGFSKVEVEKKPTKISKKSKKSKYHNYQKDTVHFEYNRNPKATTLQLEEGAPTADCMKKGLTLRYKYNNPIFNELMRGKGETLSMANYEYVFNNTQEISKIKPLNMEHVKFSANSFLHWINASNINDFSRSPIMDTFSNTAEENNISKFQSIEEKILLVFNNGLEYLNSPNKYPVDTLVNEFKVITQEMINLDTNFIPTAILKIEIFLQNSFNIIDNHGSNYFVFIILFFPIFQLAIIVKFLQLNKANDILIKNSLRTFKKYIINFFQRLVRIWSPKSIASSLINYSDENKSTVIFDILLILCKISSSILKNETTWIGITERVVTSSFKYANIETLCDFVELMMNFRDTIKIFMDNNKVSLQITDCNYSSGNWDIVEFLVDKVGNFSISAKEEDQPFQEYNLYKKHKRIFKLVNNIITYYHWDEDDLLFKSLIKLIKKRNFVSFNSEYLSFKTLDKMILKDSVEISSSDTLCTTFIKMVIRSSFKKNSKVKYHRIVQIFEPNSNIFSNNAKPDTFLQTFINKMNMLTLNSYLVPTNDYSLIISKLLKSIVIQDDLACYEKALDSILSYCKYTKVDAKVSIFDEVFTPLISKYETFVSDSSMNQYSTTLQDTATRYSFLLTTIIRKTSETAILDSHLYHSIKIFLSSVSFPKIFQLPLFKYIELSQSITDLLDIILKQINKPIKHWNSLARNSYETQIDKSEIAGLINSKLWIPIINLLQTAASTDAFILNNSIIIDLISTLSSISNLLVRLNMDNWITLCYKWNLYGLDKYLLIWLSKVLYFGGKFCLNSDPDAYIDIFVRIIAKPDPGRFSHSYFNNLMKSDVYNNEWLAFKKNLKINNAVLFGFGLIQRTLILSHFISNALIVSKVNSGERVKAIDYLIKIMDVATYELAQLKKKKLLVTYDAKQISLIEYETFIKKSLFSLNTPYGRKLLSKSKSFSIISKLFGNPKAAKERTLKNDIEDILTNIDDARTVDMDAEQDKRMIVLIQKKITNALINNKQDKFIKDLCNSIIEVDKDYFSNDIFSSHSKLFYVCGLIQIHLNFFKNFGQFSWLFILYLCKSLHKLLILSAPLGIKDFELLFKLVGCIDLLCKGPTEVYLEDLDSLKYNIKKFYHSYMRYTFAEIYDMLFDIYNLLSPGDRIVLQRILRSRTSILKKRDWKTFPEVINPNDIFLEENNSQSESQLNSCQIEGFNTSIIPQSTIDELHLYIKTSLRAVFTNNKFDELRSKKVSSSGNKINDVDLYFINTESVKIIDDSYLKLINVLDAGSECNIELENTILDFNY